MASRLFRFLLTSGLPLPRGKIHLTACILIPLLVSSLRSEAILFYSTADTNYNTSAPTGTLENSGWQYMGLWLDFQGTVISSNCFISALHIGGSVGDRILVGDQYYRTVASYVDPHSDLIIWKVCGTFTNIAPLFSGTNELGKGSVIMGRGTQRGEAVSVKGKLKGWQWGIPDGRMRWGENEVSHVLVAGTPTELTGPDIRGGDFLRFEFNASGGPNECHLSGGDSGGPLFIQEDGVWKLAGVNYAVDGPYNTNTVGLGFQAAVFDTGGLYETEDGVTWTWSLDTVADRPSAFYSTRITNRQSWIREILDQASIPSTIPGLESARNVEGPFSPDTSAELDSAAKVFRVVPGGDQRFYRLVSCESVDSIKAIRLQGDRLEISY